MASTSTVETPTQPKDRPSPELRWVGRGGGSRHTPRAVVLVLHGGVVSSHRRVGWWGTPVLRMLPIARAIAQAGRGGIAVARVKNVYAGWNDAEADGARDARLAIDVVAERFPGAPIILVGHSMGGRSAMWAADDERVHAVLGLAPWVVPGDPVTVREGQQWLLAHGRSDRVTDPRATLAFTEAAGPGTQVSMVFVEREGHTMLSRWRTWDDLAAAFVVGALGGRLDVLSIDPVVAETVGTLPPASPGRRGRLTTPELQRGCPTRANRAAGWMPGGMRAAAPTPIVPRVRCRGV